MKLKASVLFAKRLIFPLAGRKSSARKSLVGAVVCIGISVVPLVSVISVADGMINGMTDRIIGLSTGHLQSCVYRKFYNDISYEKILSFTEKIRETEGVRQAVPQLETDALAAGKNYRTGVHLRAVPPEIFTENKYFMKYFMTVDGSFDGFSYGMKQAVVGQKTAELLGIKAGDTFRIITTGGGRTPAPKITAFNVSAVVSSGYQELDALWVFIPVDTALSALSGANCTFTVMIETEDAFSSGLFAVRKNIDGKIGKEAVTYTWRELNSSQFENFSSTKIMLVFVMMLIVLVAAVNISSALVMLVIERRREIAILRSVGGTSGGITAAFLMTGCFCGLAGCLIGIPVGVFCSANINRIVLLTERAVNFFGRLFFVMQGNEPASFIAAKLMDPAYYLTEIPVVIPVKSIAAVVLAVVFLSFLVSVVPSVKAGREKPLDILRKC